MATRRESKCFQALTSNEGVLDPGFSRFARVHCMFTSEHCIDASVRCMLALDDCIDALVRCIDALVQCVFTLERCIYALGRCIDALDRCMVALERCNYALDGCKPGKWVCVNARVRFNCVLRRWRVGLFGGVSPVLLVPRHGLACRSAPTGVLQAMRTL